MADDTSYSTFLARANQDPKSGHSAEGESTSQARSKYDPSSASHDGIPSSLNGIKATYTSDTDSDFEPVFFSYASDELPSVDDFRDVLGRKGGDVDIEELSVESWDRRGEYGDVVRRVREAGSGGEVKVFRVGGTGGRVEYYVLTVGDRKLVGVVVKAVES